MRNPFSRLGLAVQLAWVVGCSDPGVGPARVVSDSLLVVARIAPQEVSPGDSLRLTAVFHNRLERPIGIGFPVGCPFILDVFRSGSRSRISLDGSGYSCTQAVSFLTIPAMDSVAPSILLYASVDGVPAAPGQYLVQLDFTNGLWELETSFWVR